MGKWDVTSKSLHDVNQIKETKGVTRYTSTTEEMTRKKCWDVRRYGDGALPLGILHNKSFSVKFVLLCWKRGFSAKKTLLNNSQCQTVKGNNMSILGLEIIEGKNQRPAACRPLLPILKLPSHIPQLPGDMTSHHSRFQTTISISPLVEKTYPADFLNVQILHFAQNI